jgi:hypothetical protein
MTTTEIWNTAEEFGVSYDVAKEILEREERYAAGEDVEPTDPRDEE